MGRLVRVRFGAPHDARLQFAFIREGGEACLIQMIAAASGRRFGVVGP